MFAAVIGMEDVRIDAEVMALFVFVDVARRGAIVDATESIDRVGFEEERVGQASFARRTMPDERNIAHVVDHMLVHENLPWETGRSNCWGLHRRWLTVARARHVPSGEAVGRVRQRSRLTSLHPSNFGNRLAPLRASRSCFRRAPDR